MGLTLRGSSGGSATTDASALTSGTLAIARIADGSVTDAKLASGASGSKPLTRTGVKTANYTAAMWDLVPCDTSGGAFTLTFPAASGGKGRVAIKLVTAGNTLNLALTGSDHFNTSTGSTTGTMTVTSQGLIAESDGSSIWTITAADIPLSGMDARYVSPTLVDAKGDLFAGTANDTLARLAVGGDGLTLAADSSQTSGLAWKFNAGNRLRKIVSGNYYGHAGGASYATSAVNQSKLYFIPIWLPEAATFNSIECEVTTFASGGAVRLGVYSSNSNDQPVTLVTDFGTVDASSASGVKAIAISQALGPGLYWLAAAGQGAALSMRTINNATSGPIAPTSFAGSTTNQTMSCYSQAGVTGSLPGTISAWTADNSPPKIMVKAA